MTAAARTNTELPAALTLPPLGEVPKEMDAWVIRKERFGEPLTSFKREIDAHARARPGRGARPRDGRRRELQRHLGRPRQARQHPRRARRRTSTSPARDASGVVWKLGQGVTRWKVGDEVVLHCNVTCGQCGACNGFDPMACEDQKIWGYETPYGSFAQFTLVQAQQLLKKPKDALVGGRGELRARLLHRLPDARRPRARAAGRERPHLGSERRPRHLRRADHEAPRRDRRSASSRRRRRASSPRASGATTSSTATTTRASPTSRTRRPSKRRRAPRRRRRSARRFWELIGEKKGPDVVFEHVGQETFPTSVFLANRMGRIVICGATTGFQL